MRRKYSENQTVRRSTRLNPPSKEKIGFQKLKIEFISKRKQVPKQSKNFTINSPLLFDSNDEKSTSSRRIDGSSKLDIKFTKIRDSFTKLPNETNQRASVNVAQKINQNKDSFYGRQESKKPIKSEKRSTTIKNETDANILPKHVKTSIHLNPKLIKAKIAKQDRKIVSNFVDEGKKSKSQQNFTNVLQKNLENSQNILKDKVQNITEQNEKKSIINPKNVECKTTKGRPKSVLTIKSNNDPKSKVKMKKFHIDEKKLKTDSKQNSIQATEFQNSTFEQDLCTLLTSCKIQHYGENFDHRSKAAFKVLSNESHTNAPIEEHTCDHLENKNNPQCSVVKEENDSRESISHDLSEFSDMFSKTLYVGNYSENLNISSLLDQVTKIEKKLPHFTPTEENWCADFDFWRCSLP